MILSLCCCLLCLSFCAYKDICTRFIHLHIYRFNHFYLLVGRHVNTIKLVVCVCLVERVSFSHALRILRLGIICFKKTTPKPRNSGVAAFQPYTLDPKHQPKPPPQKKKKTLFGRRPSSGWRGSLRRSSRRATSRGMPCLGFKGGFKGAKDTLQRG